jgi:small subunit ribosomal protein S1
MSTNNDLLNENKEENEMDEQVVVKEQDKVEEKEEKEETEVTNEPEALTDQDSQDESQEMNDMMEEIEKTMVRLHSGDIVKGHVINVTQDEVIVNLGYKSDGIIPRDEVASDIAANLPAHFSVGDEIEVCVVQVDDGDGNVLLSRKKVEAMNEWVELNEAKEADKPIEVVLKEVVRGGMIAYYKNVKCFIPASQLSDRYVDDLSVFVGDVCNVHILEMDRRRSKIILSRKAVIQEEKEHKKKELLKTLEKGQIVEGQVKQITNFGAFVDIGGIDGLIHISELSWGRVKHPSDVLSIGQDVKVEVLDFEESSERISLSLKATEPEPWKVAGEKYQVGEIIEGEVVRLVDFGAFIEIEPGLDGLVHISQISEAHVAKPSDVLQKGQKVEVKILDINVSEQRMSLSIAAIERDKKEAEEKEMVEETAVAPTEAEASTMGEALDKALKTEEVSEEENAEESHSEASETPVDTHEETVQDEVEEEIEKKTAEVTVEDAVEEESPVSQEETVEPVMTESDETAPASLEDEKADDEETAEEKVEENDEEEKA